MAWDAIYPKPLAGAETDIVTSSVFKQFAAWMWLSLNQNSKAGRL